MADFAVLIVSVRHINSIANADGAIILANSSHTEANNTNRHIYTTVVHEADIVIIRYR